MTHLIAHFPDQGSAMAAMQRLMARGFPSSRVLPVTDGGVRGSAGSDNAPSNVVSSLSHRADRPTEGWPAGRRVDEVGPEQLGAAWLELETGESGMSESDLRNFLEQAGAYRVDASSSPMATEALGVWPEAPRGDAVDVERAVDAARRGSEKSGEDLPLPGEGPSLKTRHDPHR
ncbi:hypothetical protein L2Y94_10030 [Luteibacter aegosomatis]|uniref:hypothetical protein n=1 Tax=Luteibacter aegosomatis TaxID=2911537 RepID=UPI001FF98DAF|nr:hypothetical protein [Luteibacter aegosomatis]UPG87668.1 hypothetical protein L2Y94_10030 [Luteibacter aegosomatis]